MDANSMTKDYTVTEFIKLLQDYNKEIGCNGETIGSHKIKSSVGFYLDDGEGGYSGPTLKLNGYEASLLPGCLCWDGIRFFFKEEVDIKFDREFIIKRIKSDLTKLLDWKLCTCSDEMLSSALHSENCPYTKMIDLFQHVEKILK